MASIAETDLELVNWQELHFASMRGAAMKQRVKAWHQQDRLSIKSMISI